MDPRHVLIALAFLFAVGCASGDDATPSTTTSGAVATSSTLVSETSQPGSSSVEQPEPDDGEPDPVEPVPSLAPGPVQSTSSLAPDPVVATLPLEGPVEPVATTTTALTVEGPEVVDSPPSAVEAVEGDSGSSVSGSLQVADRPESAVAVLQGRLEALVLQPERRSGYDRDLFDHWVDADGDRCDARREVLIAEAVVAPRVGTSCSLSGGQWYSVYDGAAEQGSGRGFDVDHLVPLAEAWDSGAYGWDSDTRRRYANDLGYAHSLVAVSSSSNRQKGAGDPADWLPPLASARCWYAEAWIAVKTRWGLSIDTAELQALRSVVSQCQDWQLGSAPVQATTVVAAPTTDSGPTTTTTLAVVEDLCHPAYIPCLPNLPGDALNCGDLSSSQKPVQVRTIGVDPYRLDRDGNGFACTS
ncbi:MAG: HNH endonuclease family protein [Acidimicrobiaceae bacterium]|nr:HNH endonuclease family protein [Acidimicrobiaceae bacterium]